MGGIIIKLIIKIFKSKIFRYGLLGIFLGLLVGASVVFYHFYKIASELPSGEEIVQYRFSEPSLVYDSSGSIIAELGIERRYPISINDMPKYLLDAVVATEDARFYEHKGIDFIGIARAVVRNVKSRRFTEGGSTLTQQLVKNIYLTPERSMMRKFKEAVMAYRIDKILSKDEILEFYLNYVNFGRGGYGIQSASINYFGKNAKDLTLSESALLAGMPKAPSLYAPHINMGKALTRRNHVLGRMVYLGYITEDEYYAALEDNITIIPSPPLRRNNAGYFLDYVLNYLVNDLGIEQHQSNGLKIYTTLNMDFQKKAEDSVKDKLRENARRLGYFGPVYSNVNINDGLVKEDNNGDGITVTSSFDSKMVVPNYLKSMGYLKAIVLEVKPHFVKIMLLDKTEGVINLKDNKWAKPAYSNRELNNFSTILSKNDIIYVIKKDDVVITDDSVQEYLLEQDPPMEAALVAVDPHSGAILAMVGGMSFDKSQFNRAAQSKRQLGSSFKPIIYSAAIVDGMQPMTKILDAPYLTQEDENGVRWRPKNYDSRYFGETTLKQGIVRSRNTVTIKIAEKVGLKKILFFASQFGIKEELEKDLSIALGSGSASLIDMTYAFTVFPNMGVRNETPYFITKVVDRNGKVLFDLTNTKKLRVLEPKVAQVMTDMLVSAVENGSGFRAKVIPRPVGAKTGTSNSDKDAWFMGFLPNLMVGVWVGFDDFSRVGVGPGSLAAGPLWVSFVSSIINELPEELFPVSDGVVYKKVDTTTWEPVTDVRLEGTSFEPYVSLENDSY